jgi:hypothetical protein
VLFFFEAGLFLLFILAIGLAEFVGRGPALALWVLATALSLVGQRVVPARLARVEADDQLDQRWRRDFSDGWRHTNKVLLIGLLFFGGWWWIDTLTPR